MAKKKKSKAKKTTTKKGEEATSAFWPLTGAVLLLILSVFLLLGGFGAGGALPVKLFAWGYSIFGWSAYFLPFTLAFLGGLKFVNDDKQIPLDRFVSASLFMVASSTLFHTLFVSVGKAENVGGHGGVIGRWVGDASLLALNKLPASLFFFIIALLALFFALRISPKALLKPLRLLKKKPSKDGDQDLMSLRSEGQFTLNKGVPIERSTAIDSSRSSTLKNTAQKLTPIENHEALTTASDPDWRFPSVDLLNKEQDKADPGDIENNAKIIKDTFGNFNIGVDMDGANVGPRITQYTLKPPTGVKLTKITALENNLALDLAAEAIRIEAPIPGKRLVGIEVPNKKPATVNIGSILSSKQWQSSKNPLEFVIGKDITGAPIMSDLASLPHLLVAGQTGSGKSVMINSILTSLLYKNSPSDLKLILIDPKQVELTPYDGIPHLLAPVVHEPEKCISALKWAIAEMQRRLKTMAEHGKRNIGEFNKLSGEESMPYIVIVIDELAELMMMAARDVEGLIVRLAQKSRAAGIHLVLATQRPSVDVITGLIKANVPGRIAFMTQSQVDSRTIINQMGAEKLLGRGDMLLLIPGMHQPHRVQAAFISDDDASKVINFIRDQRAPQYDDEIINQPVQLNGRGGLIVENTNQDLEDDLWRDAVQVVIDGGKASTSLLQRRLRVGYSRASRLIETMEEKGIVGPADGSRPREVLISSMSDVFGGDAEDDIYDEIPDDETEA